MKKVNFPVSKKDYCKVEEQNKICFNVSCYENKLTYPVYITNQKFKDYMDLLLISDEDKSQYVYIEDFDRFMLNKTKNKDKKYFCRCCLQCFSNQKVLIEHRKGFLVVNGKQNVKLKSGSISFKNYFKQITVPFKIYAGFECIPKPFECNSTECNNSSYTKKYQDHIPCSLAYKVVIINLVLIINFVKMSSC